MKILGRNTPYSNMSADINELRQLKGILIDFFCNSTGLQVNYNKTSLVLPINVKDEQAKIHC
jgi:translation initiation factor 2 beta subunit (eIF-2beta)/eIF-5